MSVKDWTEIQRKVAKIIYAETWQSPCDHAGPVWYVGPDGIGWCTVCGTRWPVS